ncbi:MAG: terminase gpA endonuclease subunit, partial [Gemmatimonadota bacterium]|nr:terminase gpA endonuclease subunit [Gemmatimonadota bacterium]
ARQFLEVKGRPMRLKTFVNTMLGETWEDTGERVEAHMLVDRLEKFPADVPEDVICLTAGVDVQDHYLEVWVWGWGREQSSAPIYWEQIPGDPGTPAPWRALDEIRRRRWTNAAGKEFRIVSGFVDSGGHHTQQVYNWCRPRQKARWFACKGVGGEGVALVGKPTFQGEAKVMLRSVGVFTAKEQFLRSQLHVREEGPEFVRLPDWLTIEHLKGLTSEKLVKRIVGNKRVREWVTIHDRNEPLDCRNYAFAALHGLPLRWLQKMGIVATATPKRPAVAPPKPPPPVEGAEPPQAEPVDVTPTDDPNEDDEIAPRKRKRRRIRWNPRGF